MNQLRFYGALSAVTLAGLCSAAHAQTPVTPLIALSAAQDPQTTPAPQTPQTPQTPTRQEDETPRQQERRRRVPQIGPQVGVYFPTNSRTRDAFGDSWFNYGVGFRPLRLETSAGTTSLDISVFSSSRSGSRAIIIPINAMYKVALGKVSNVEGEGENSLRPYAGVSLGIYVADIRADRYNVGSGWQGAFGGSVLLGTTYQQSVYLEARYHIISEMKSFDLSGLNIALGARF